MLIPSIDIQGGRAVQLVGGREMALDAGDPFAVAERFAVAGELAVIDLDAALGRGSNADIIERIARRFPCRVGGGIRDVATAVRWLDRGARRVILGTAAVPEVLRELPKERVLAALDSRDGDVVVEGWTRPTGRDVLSRVTELDPFVSGYLVTFVETEGRMRGLDLDRAAEIARATRRGRVTIAGGVTTPAHIAALDALGADAQVGMALYTGRLDLADALAAPLVSDRPDGLWPTIVADERGTALGLAWSDPESLREAIRSRRGVYRSRTRGLWITGESSGDTQELLRVDLDCDRDALRFTVRQKGAGFCHLGTRTCFGDDRGIGRLSRRLADRLEKAPEGSYTKRLLGHPDLLAAKLLEEAQELAEAAPERAEEEAADLVYFALVALSRAGKRLEDLEAVLDRRELAVTRRKGDAKPRRVGDAPESAGGGRAT